MPSKKSTAVLAPNLGVYLDRPKLALSDRMLEDCKNVRIKNGKIIRDNVGWDSFMATSLTDPVTLIDQHFLSTGGQILIFGTTKNLFQYNEAATDVTYINAQHVTGTVEVTLSSTSVVGTGTGWTSAITSTGVQAGWEIHFGKTSAVSVNLAWHPIATVSSDTSITLTSVPAFASATASGVAYTIRQTYTGDQFDAWETAVYPNVAPTSGGTIGDQWYATNGVDNIQRWNGVDLTVTDLASLAFTCKDLTIYKEMLICSNVTEAGQTKFNSMKHSDIGVPEEFTTGLSGEFVVHDGVDPIIKTKVLGDNLVFYGERGITLSQFVGAPTNFIFRSVVRSFGPQSSRAIADFGDFHEFLAEDAQYKFDGISINKINTHIWREVLRTHSTLREAFIQAHIDEENGEVLWIIPKTSDTSDADTGQPETAYVQNYLEEVKDESKQPFTIRDLPATATGYFDRVSTLRFSDIITGFDTQNNRWNDRFFQGAFPLNLFGDENGAIYILSEIDSQNGASIDSFARFGLRPTVDGKMTGIIKRVYPFTEVLPTDTVGLSVTVLTTNQADGAVTSASTLSYDLAHSNHSRYFVSPFVAGRFYQIEFRRTGTGVPFNLSGYDVDAQRGGRR